MDLLILTLLFVWGTLLGSFLNVLIDRFSTDRSVVKGRSYCENCKKTLSWKELVPLLSYAIQGGKCIHCKAKIPSRLFVVEFLTGLLLPVIYLYVLYQGLPLYSAVNLTLVLYSLIGIFFADLEYGLIPDKFLVILIFAAFLCIISVDGKILDHILSGLGAFAFFFALFLFTKGRGMGFGDVKLAFAERRIIT